MTVIAVTGATGFLGRHVLDRLEAACPDAAVRALTRRQQSDRRGVNWVSGALGDQAALEDLVRDADAVIHLAGAVKARRQADFHAVNGIGTGAVLEAMVRQAPNAGFIHVSSLAARCPELSAYAGSKAAAEDIVRGLGAARRWTILRPPGVYGPGDGEILKLLKAARHGFLPAPGRLDNRVSLIHARDLAELIARLAMRKLYNHSVIEVDDGQADGYDYADLARILTQVLGRRVRPVRVPSAILRTVGTLNSLSARMTGHTPMLTAGKAFELCHPDWVTRARPELLSDIWTPRIGLADGLRETLKAARRDGLL